MDVRTLITESLSRANIVPRRQAAPGYLVEDALLLLQGIISKYNNDNYLAFTQNTIDLPASRLIHIYGEENTLGGEHNLYFDSADALSSYEITEEDYENDVWAYLNDGQHPNVIYHIVKPLQDVYSWVPAPNQELNPRFQQMKKYADACHVKIDNVNKLNTLHVNRGEVYGMLKLHFLPRDDFDGYVDNDLFYTYTPLAEGEWLIEVKPYVASGAVKLRLAYNVGFKVDIDTDIRIPDAYIELLTVALTHKLAVKYPRLDDAQMQRLEKEVGVMLDNVRTPKADTKTVKRESFETRGYTPADVMAGRMFY